MRHYQDDTDYDSDESYDPMPATFNDEDEDLQSGVYQQELEDQRELQSIKEKPAEEVPIEDRPYSEKYYDLIQLLPAQWFEDIAKWQKIAYALYNCDEIDDSLSFGTLLKATIARKKFGWIKIAADMWKSIDSSCDKPITLGTIKHAISQTNKEGYNNWKTKYPVKKSKHDKTEEEELESLYEEMKTAIQSFSHELIRERNGIEFNDLIMNDDEEYSVKDFALMLRQTIVRVENNAEPVFYAKEIIETKYKRTINKAIRYVPRYLRQMVGYVFKIKYSDKVFNLKLIDILKNVKKTINYRKVVLEPFGALDNDTSYKRKNFNLFNGLLHEYDPKYVPDEKKVMVWLDHIKLVLCNNDEALFNYFKIYFKHILVNPMTKTGVVIIVKGKQGSGKNAAFDIFFRYVLGANLALTTPRMDLVTGRFNAIRESLIMCLFDEAVDNSDRAAMNAFKNLITALETHIERKGKDPVRLDDFCNYIVVSNQDFASFIEESDRRALCIETNDSMINNREYFSNYWGTLENEYAGKDIFHWLIQKVEIPSNWHPQNIPTTAYKQELKKIQSNTCIKFLLDLYEKLCDSDDDEDYELTVDMMYIRYTTFCENSRCRNIMSKQAFGRCSKNYFEHTRDTKGMRVKKYSRAILEESLKAYL